MRETTNPLPADAVTIPASARDEQDHFQWLRHEDDVGAAAVMLLSFLRLRAELESSDLSGLTDGDIRRQDT